LWHNAGGSSSELEAYLERSKSVPLKVTLSSPHSVVPIASHTSRFVALTIYLTDHSPGLDQITEHLRDPIPTLQSLEIQTRLHILEIPSGLSEGLFRHLKSLSLNAIPSFPGPQTFPHITELSLSTTGTYYGSTTNILDALERLPGLVKVSVVFRANSYIEPYSRKIVTLPHVQEMHLRSIAIDGSEESAAILPILQSLELPKATSITVQSRFSSITSQPILPVGSFGERLPNYIELPELQINTTTLSGEVVFRSLSGAVFTYKTGPLDGYERDREIWGNLPVSSVRKATVVLGYPELGDEVVWVVDMLMDLCFLEVLELGGDCGRALQLLRHRLVRGVMQTSIRTLAVRGGEYAKIQALKLESAKDDIGLQGMTVTYAPDPEAYEVFPGNLDAESSNDDDDLNEGSDLDHEDDDEDSERGSDPDYENDDEDE
jgi:hypothetical protein